MTHPRRLLGATLAAGALLVSLVACQAETTTLAPEPAVVNTPERIASLSYETTEILAALGLEDHIVIMPEAVRNPVLGSHQEQLADVPATYAVEKELTAEAVIETAPDLVLMSPRHGAEDTIGKVLGAAGIDTLVTENTWGTPDELVANVRLIGDAVGAVDQAETLAAALDAGLASRGQADPPPSVLVLSNQAGRPFVTAGQAFPLELVRLAGGADASEALGITTTGPIQVEQVLAADPDGIILVDMNGTGDRLFEELLANEAIQQLAAVQEGRVLRVEGKEVQALGLTETIAGLDRVAAWIGAFRPGE